ncbi:MAG TPA: GntR family transcriptional regulator [Actinophytocola sp.]|uniref:GntR family transcriptional regulator n=1 Tax=Actinophytocola sp. TaxID=1872138 RepID=UPI002DB76870|nr:GntR family transcriptional regulator [Actinophytocola sp.]HEU5473291.1 GntR family transcriptional regulator [Actinophytocola sp.]
MAAGVEWAGLDRISTAERVAGILRDQIETGKLKPGTKLSEEEITTGLGISRNTLREAFRLLVHERLLEHRFNHGVTVRMVGLDDLRDLYQVRRVIECSAVRGVTELSDTARTRLHEAVLDAQDAAKEGRWADVGTANLRFHQAIVGMIGSPRIDEVMRRVWAELRLVWHVLDDPRTSFERYISVNSELLDLLLIGDFTRAEKVLKTYLTSAEKQFVAAYAEASHR